jgi:hypothetical protein
MIGPGRKGNAPSLVRIGGPYNVDILEIAGACP